MPPSSGAVTVRPAGIEPAHPGWLPGTLTNHATDAHSTQYRWLGSNQRPSPYEGDALNQLSYTGILTPEPTVGIEPTPTRYEGVAPPWSHVGDKRVAGGSRTRTTPVHSRVPQPLWVRPQYPREESNLNFDLRRVACHRHTPRTTFRTVTREGVEPSRPFGHRLLRPVCLPIPSPGHEGESSSRQCTWRESNPHRPGANRPSSR